MQTIYGGIYAVCFLILGIHWRQAIHIAMANKLLLLLLGIAFASVFWSVAPEVTVRRSAALAGTTLFGFYLAMRFSLSAQLRLLACMLGISALLSLVFALALPTIYGPFSAEPWRGIYEGKNQLGVHMALGSLVFLLIAMNDRRHSWVAWTACALSVILLLLSNSMTSLIIFVGLLILLPLYRVLRWDYTLSISFLIVAVLLGGSIALWLWSNQEAVLTALGRDVTMSQRTLLWAAVVDMIQERPWLGYGYGAFWLDAAGMSSSIIMGLNLGSFPYAHNGILDLWLDLGLLGVSAFIVMFLIYSLRAVAWVRSTKTAEGLWPLAYTTFILLFNMTEGAFLRQNSALWVLYVATMSSLAIKRDGFHLRARANKVAARLQKPSPSGAYGEVRSRS